MRFPGVADELEDLLSVCRNGARIPSIADDVATDRSTLRSRCKGSRRWGFVLESLEPMVK